MMGVLMALGWLLLTLLKIAGVLLLILLVLLALVLLCPLCADVCWEGGVLTVRAGALGLTLPVFQSALLDIAAQYVAPGGVLVYSTCTILPEENEQVTDAFLTEHSDFCRDGFTLPAPVGETEGQLTLWPQRHGTDGFYICRMKRT